MLKPKERLGCRVAVAMLCLYHHTWIHDLNVFKADASDCTINADSTQDDVRGVRGQLGLESEKA